MKTGLYEKHLSLGAKMVDFAGWSMPVQYQGIIQEHLAVRERAGIFDVSHMGRVIIQGPDAEPFLDFLSTNSIVGKKDLSATYTVWCYTTGGSVDDLIVYKQNKELFFVIVNASNREKDLAHLKSFAASFNVEIIDRYSDGILAIQGPKAKGIVRQALEEVDALKPMRFALAKYQGEELILSETGYTGAGGVEIYAPMPLVVKLWDLFLELGKEAGLKPAGLGARNTLRLEMGYALYGHELGSAISPSESVSSWTVKWDKPDFLGKDSLLKLEEGPKKRHQYGIIMTDKGVAREDYPVYCEDQLIGKVTSGTMSPTLGRAIAIIMVDKALGEGDRVSVQIRSNKVGGKVVKLPFLQT